MAERKSFLMRIDPALWADLEVWAQAELRSVNGQIEYFLRQAGRSERVVPVPRPARARYRQTIANIRLQTVVMTRIKFFDWTPAPTER